jgi:hypothetical protein
MTRLSSLVLALGAAALPSIAAAQTAASRDAAPLAPVWIVVSLLIVAALLWLLVREPGARARESASARRRTTPPTTP